MTQIHFPTLAHPDFAGKTGAGDIGDAMADVDDNVGLVLDAIDRLGIARNTIVFWCTDNGAEQRRPWRGSSGPWSGFYNTVMEGGIRTPCIIRWPGRIPAGRVTERDRPPDRSLPDARRGGRAPTSCRRIAPSTASTSCRSSRASNSEVEPRQRALLHQHPAARGEVARLEVPLRLHAGAGAPPAAADAPLQPAVRSEGRNGHQGRQPVGGERDGQGGEFAPPRRAIRTPPNAADLARPPKRP